MRARKKLQFRLAAVLCVLFGVTCVAMNISISAFVSNQAHTILISQARQDLYDASREAIDNLTDLFAGYEQSLNLLASNNRITMFLKYYQTLPQRTRLTMESSITTYIDEATAIQPDILDVVVVSDDLFVNRLTRGDIRDDFDYKQTEWYQEMTRTHTPALWPLRLDFYKNSPLIGARAIALGVPVFSYEGSYVGAIFFFLDQSAVSKVPIRNKPLSEGEAYYVATEEGDVIVSFNEDESSDRLPRLPEGDSYTLEGLSGLSERQLLEQDSLWVRSPMLHGDLQVAGCVSLEGIHELFDTLRARTLLMVAVITALGCLFFFLLFVYFNRKLRRYLNYLFEMEATQSEPKQLVFREANTLTAHFHQLVRDLGEVTQKNYAYELEHNRIRLETLISQINPHFLFNALQFLQSEIMYGDRRKADQALMSLSSLFRFTLNTKGYLSTVQEEIEFTRSYLSLCQQCYAGELELEFDIQDDILPIIVPKFLIQPITENAIKHGFDSVPHHARIRIAGQRVGDQVCFVVEDNGHGLGEKALEELRRTLILGAQRDNGARIGLSNIYQRLYLLFGEDFAMDISSSENEFFRIAIRIPADSNLQRRMGFHPGQE